MKTKPTSERALLSGDTNSGSQRPFTRQGRLLPAWDAFSVILSAWGGLSLLGPWLTVSSGVGVAWLDIAGLIGVTAFLAGLLLYEPRFDALVQMRNKLTLQYGFIRRWMGLAALVGVLLYAGGWMVVYPVAAALGWLASAMALSAAGRLLLARRAWRRTAHLASASGATATAASSPANASNAFVADRLGVRLLAGRPLSPWNSVAKTVHDMVLAAVICLALLPLMTLIAIAIRIDSPGPLLFRQRRHGLGNCEFDIYKFRTMHFAPAAVATTAPLQQTLRGDPRITRVGAFLRKTSLDELPQLINVLQGSMSLVGPRPHAVDMRTESRLGEEIIEVYSHRHRVRPGMTGWSQINGARGATDTEAQLRRRVELDLHYIENWSLLLDLKILSRTPKEVLRSRNAF